MDHRDTTTEKSADYSVVLLVAPKAAGLGSRPIGDRLPPSAISVCYQGNVTRGDAHQSCRFKPQHFGANAVFQRTTKGTHEH